MKKRVTKALFNALLLAMNEIKKEKKRREKPSGWRVCWVSYNWEKANPSWEGVNPTALFFSQIASHRLTQGRSISLLLVLMPTSPAG